MARKASAPKHVEPEEESQDVPEEPDASEIEREPASGSTITQTEAIRRALGAGHEGPTEGTAYIRDEFGIEVSKGNFSATKSRLKSLGDGTSEPKRRGRKPGTATVKRGPKPKAAGQADEGYLAPPPAPKAADGDVLETLESLKPLIAQYGADRLKRMVDLLG